MNNSLIKMKKYLLYFVAAAMITACNGDWMNEIPVMNDTQAVDYIVNKPVLMGESEKWMMRKVYFLGEGYKGFKARIKLSEEHPEWHFYEDEYRKDTIEMSEILHDVTRICDISDSARCFNYKGMHAKIDRIGGYPKDRPKYMLMAVWERTDAVAQSKDGIVASLIERARRGEEEAYLQLAQRYHDGHGVKKDILMMRYMILLAEERNGKELARSFYAALPENDEARLFYDAIENPAHDVRIKTLERIYKEGLLPTKLMKGIEAILNGDEDNGRQMMKESADEGSQYAQILMLSRAYDTGNKEHVIADLEKSVDWMPFIHRILGDIYAGIDAHSEFEGLLNEDLAVMHYQKADEYACLNRRGAQWLLAYYERKGIALPETDMVRLKALGGMY